MKLTKLFGLRRFLLVLSCIFCAVILLASTFNSSAIAKVYDTNNASEGNITEGALCFSKLFTEELPSARNVWGRNKDGIPTCIEDKGQKTLFGSLSLFRNQTQYSNICIFQVGNQCYWGVPIGNTCSGTGGNWVAIDNCG